MSDYDYLREGREAFASRFEELLGGHEGEFAVFCGEGLVGVYSTLGEAFEDGSRKAGTSRLFIPLIRRDYWVSGSERPLELGRPSVRNPDGSESAMY